MKVLLSVFPILLFTGISAADPADIPITVIHTWEITYASDIQDISYNWSTDQIAIRSNGDGKIYLADPDDLSLQAEVNLPPGIQGFGLSVMPEASLGRFYVNSSTEPVIYHTDIVDSWSSFPNPAGTAGTGLDFNCLLVNDVLYQATSTPPFDFYAIANDKTSYVTYELPGVTEEISGFMVHEVMILDDDAPYAIIATTRFGHEFLFWHYDGGSYVLYAQEDCPVPVDESLGLFWDWQAFTVFWSYLGTDDKYYISELEIPVFGGIENNTSSLDGSSHLALAANPATGVATISVNLQTAEPVSLIVYDISGRVEEQLFHGMLDPGTFSWSVELPAGIYLEIGKRYRDAEVRGNTVTQ